ncbi:MAG: tetratricopeptide repeat protein, partial [Ignavibacteria bacterium]|nr:tetratricopeptide repeat protein [Ignavibacteria bacterium]
MEGKCVEALAKYDEYFEKRKSLTREEKIEYADIASRANNYPRAIQLYDEILAEGFDYKAALLRAKNYFLNSDTTKARTELESLSKINPDDDQALMLLANTYANTNRLEDAEQIYRTLKAKENSTVAKQDINQQMLFLAGNYIGAKNYERGKQIYSEIEADSISTEIRKQIDQRLIFLADSYVADKKYDEAIEEFTKLEERIADAEMLNDIYKRQTYMGYLLTQDKEFSQAEDVFNSLNTKVTDQTAKDDLNEKMLFLGDAYVQDESYGDARSMYEYLLENISDTAQIRKIKERISWLPPNGFNRGLSSIQSFFNLFLPTNINVSPYGNYYADNQKFRLWNYGLRLDAGFVGFLSIGGIWSRTTLDNTALRKDFTQFKWAASLFFTRYISLSGTYGNLATLGEPNYRIWDATIRYEKPEELSLSANFENTDA